MKNSMKKTYNLERRISKTMHFNNAVNAVIYLGIFLIVIGIMMTFFGKSLTSYVAIRIADTLGGEWEEGKDVSYIPPDLLNNVFFNYEDRKVRTNYISPKVSIDITNDQTEKKIQLFDLINYQIWKDDKLIFDSATDAENKGILPENFNRDNFVSNLINTSSEESIYNSEENIIGKVHVKVNSQFIMIIYLSVIGFIIAIILVVLFLTKIITGVLAKMIIRPLKILEVKMNELADGNIEEAINCNMVTGKQIHEFESILGAFKKIINKMQGYIKILEHQKEELEAQNITLEDNQIALNNYNKKLQQKTLKLSNILDNVGQGFFTFKNDLLIDEEYSLICERIFNKNIINLKFSELIYPNEVNQQEFIDDLIKSVFTIQDSSRDLYMSLLPEEITLHDRIYNFDYKIVFNENLEEVMIVIVTDITEKRAMEAKMDMERKLLKMVVKVIINREEFLDIVKNYKSFVGNNIKDCIENDCEKFLREIHTYKGNFSQYDLVNIVEKLNYLEDTLLNEDCRMKNNYINTEILLSWLEEDIKILENYVCKDFMNEDEIYKIRKDTLKEIEFKINNLLPKSESRVILPLIQSLRYKSIKELLKSYPEYTVKLSERLEKSIKPFEIEGDDVLIDGDKYKKLFKLLVHIFRNCVDHGIESEEERIQSGKELEGTISCDIVNYNEKYQIVIYDDGRGICCEKLIEKAIEKQIINSEELQNMNNEDIHQLIFKQGMTTKENATIISGKGIGLSAVREEVNNLNGEIMVESEKGKGTKYYITIPKSFEETSVEKNSIFSLQKMINKLSKKFVFDFSNINLKLTNTYIDNKIELFKTTALINVIGEYNIMIMISMNEELMKELIKNIIFGEIEECELESCTEDMVRELSNTIIGNAFGELEKEFLSYEMGVQAVITNDAACIKYLESQILVTNLEINIYKMKIIMFLLDGKRDLELREDFLEVIKN